MPAPCTPAVNCSDSSLGRVPQTVSLDQWRSSAGDNDLRQAGVIKNDTACDRRAQAFAVFLTYLLLFDNWLAIICGAAAVFLLPARSFG